MVEGRIYFDLEIFNDHDLNDQLKQYILERKRMCADDDMYTAIRDAVVKVEYYCDMNNVDAKDVDFTQLKRFLMEKYDFEYSMTVLREAKVFINFLNNEYEIPKLIDSEKKGMHNESESQVTKLVKDEISGRTSYIEEYTVVTDNDDVSVRGDILLDDRDTMIECKSSHTDSIHRGVSQCLTYDNYGYTPILVTPIYWKSLIDIFKENNFCLIFADTQNWRLEPVTKATQFESIKYYWTI